MSRSLEQRDYRTEPKPTGETIQDHLIFLRDTFSDEVPEEIVHSPYKDNRYKVRKNWWTGLLGSLEAIQEDHAYGAADPEELNTFIEEYFQPEFRSRLTTSSDIQRANTLINQIVIFEEEDPMLWTGDPLYAPKFV